MHYTTETFFRPPALNRQTIHIPGNLFNRCRLQLKRSGHQHLFVPIRSMQYIAVIDAEEVIFVDSLSYAVQKGEGGRMIILAWVFPPEGGRDSLNAPVPVELIAYADNTKQLQARVMTELPKALELLEERALQQGREPKEKRVLAFSR